MKGSPVARIEQLLPQARLLGARSDDAFRTILDTTSRPGLIARFIDAQFVGLPYALVPALALANVDTRIAVVGRFDGFDGFDGFDRFDGSNDDGAGTVDSWLSLVCRATDASPANIPLADIVTVLNRVDPTVVSALRPGTPEHPERGARLVLACGGLFALPTMCSTDELGDDVVFLELTGPGVRGTCRVVVVGVPEETFVRLGTVNALPSCGIDVHLVDPTGRMLSLPRSTRMTVLPTSLIHTMPSNSDPLNTTKDRPWDM